MIIPVSEAVKVAGKFLREYQSSIKPEMIELKSLNSLVSQADRKAEEILVESLQKIMPEAGFITEEETIKTDRLEYNWIIDPLDGTTNYLHGIPTYAVSVALEFRGEIIKGWVYEVCRDELFTAEKNKGSFLNGKKIGVSSRARLEDCLMATGFPYYDFERIPGFLKLISECFTKTRGLRRIGTAATDLAYMAAGRFDAYFEYGLSPWDVAAGSLIASEAGAIVSTFSGSDDYIFGKEILVVQPNIADEFSELIRKYMLNYEG